eukprot:gi/632961953/ref/XP_007897043.1/ PREDICTED: colorectal mutant cancer protein-like isoform X1 [Callorhinchus milii]
MQFFLPSACEDRTGLCLRGPHSPSQGECAEEEEDEAVQVLRYEGRITELLVVIAELNRRINRLKYSTFREEDEDEYQDESSDHSDSSCALDVTNRCESQDHSAASGVDQQPQPISPDTDVSQGLSPELQRVLAELEASVHRRRRQIPLGMPDPEKYSREAKAAQEHWSLVTQAVAEVERELELEPCPDWSEERSARKSEINDMRERNRCLAAELQEREQELSKAKVTLTAFQGERDRMRQRVQDLSSCLQRMEEETQSDQHLSDVRSSGTDKAEAVANRDPHSSMGTLFQTLQCCSTDQDVFRALQTHELNLTKSRIREFETETERLKQCIDKWRRQNNRLCAVLDECKSDGERLSMLLGKHESNSTALQLALQYTEKCIEAYSLLLALTETNLKKEATSGPRASAPRAQVQTLDCPAPCDVLQDKVGLKSKIARLRVEHAAVKRTLLELGETPAHLKRYSATTEGGQAKPHRLEIVPTVTEQDAGATSGLHWPEPPQRPRKEKWELLRDLVDVREEMAELKGQTSLMKRERRDLEQILLCQVPRESAVLLLIEHWRSERDEGMDRPPPFDITGETVRTSKEVVGEGADSSQVPGLCNKQLMSDLLDSTKGEKQLKVRAGELAMSLERSIQDSNSQSHTSARLVSDLRNTHSNLSTAYRTAQRKYENQLMKLEFQISAMSERHRAQIAELEQSAKKLQEELDNSNGTPL